MGFETEVRRCAACGQDAMTCDLVVDHQRQGQSLGLRGQFACAKCGAVVGLATTGLIVGLTVAAGAVPAALGAVLMAVGLTAHERMTSQDTYGFACGAVLVAIGAPAFILAFRQLMARRRHPVVGTRA